MEIIICILLSVVVGMLGVIGYMLHLFLNKGMPMNDEHGRYMTDADINSLVSAKERAIKENTKLNNEHINQPPPMGSSTIGSGERLVHNNRPNPDLIPYGLSEMDKDILDEFYR